MKKLIAILLISVGTSCQNASKKQVGTAAENDGTPKFEFQEEFHNFGSLKAGEVVSYSFQFKNVGDGNLKIDKVATDCGCTEVHFPEKAIVPGQSDFIEVVFNSSGETGNSYKQIEVYANTPLRPVKLSISANVKNEVINLYSKN